MNPVPSIHGPVRLGDFVVLGVLGEGGSGVVYDARWGHREIALKVLHPTLVASPREREQFLAEARRLAEIHHPGVVKVLAVGAVADGRPFLAMEKLRGETLAARLVRGPLPVTAALELFGQVTDAVEALHGRGLVHRDLKPENVVLVVGADGREHAVLLDFGIAKELASAPSTTTQEGGVRGTPAYMAQERFFGQPASFATDIYELAVTLFAMLAGRLPWDDAADPEVRLDPRRLADVAPHVPAALDVEVRRALSTRVQNRPTSAADLRAAVMAAAGAAWAPRSTAPVPVPVPEPLPGPVTPRYASTTQTTSRRGRTAAIVVGVAVAATGVGVAAHLLSAPSDTIHKQQRSAAGVVANVRDEPPAPPAAEPAVEVAAAPRGFIDAVKPDHRRELARRLVHLPDDELFALGVQIAELDRDADLRPVIDLFGTSRPGLLLRAETNLGACQLDLRATTDWVVIAGPADDAVVDLLAAGRWSRAEVEACVVAAVGADAAVPISATVSRFEGSLGARTVGWIDDRTFLISSRADADAAWMEARLADTTPPAGALGGAIGQIDAGALIWVAGDEKDLTRGTLTDGTDMTGLWGSLDADADRLRLGLRIRYPSSKEAAAARDELQETFGELGMSDALGRVQLDVDPAHADVLHVEIAMARMIARLLISSAAAGLDP
jgi:serine/threonine protein kinase